MWNFNYDSPKEISQILDLASLAMTKRNRARPGVYHIAFIEKRGKGQGV